jgi:DNA adenine methylase
MLTFQPHLFHGMGPRLANPPRSSLLKWVGNKGRFAHQIVSYFPSTVGTYFEPFLGSGAILATLAPERGLGSDCSRPLVEIWQGLHDSPKMLKHWYSERWHAMMKGDKKAVYEEIKRSYNQKPNGADLIFLCRACYGGVVRFRQADGYMSTPCGVHTPISPESFSRRVDEWYSRTTGLTFARMDYREAMARARSGDLIYCDPPYTHSQSILYGAQSFDLGELLEVIGSCKSRGAFVALSIDGTKRSGNLICDLPLPKDLFEREVFVNCGRSMLKRFQMNGRTLENEVVTDRLLLTF